jgi:hypothetical protein
MLVGWSVGRSVGRSVGPLVGRSVRWLVGPSVPISLRKLVTSQLLRAWGLVTTLFNNVSLIDHGIHLNHDGDILVELANQSHDLNEFVDGLIGRLTD